MRGARGVGQSGALITGIAIAGWGPCEWKLEFAVRVIWFKRKRGMVGGPGLCLSKGSLGPQQHLPPLTTELKNTEAPAPMHFLFP